MYCSSPVFAELDSLNALELLRVHMLGKKGQLTAMLRMMGQLTAEERPQIGQLINERRERFTRMLDERQKGAAAFCSKLTDDEKDTLIALLDKLLGE